jgi:ribonuclease-3 family protein
LEVFMPEMPQLFTPVWPPEALRAMPTLTLAYVGDGVYELLARNAALAAGVAKAAGMHRRVVAWTRAEAQAQAARALLPTLAESERAVFLRGRNAKPHSSPAHASAAEYALATALEALIGWLYLSGEYPRLAELWAVIAETLAAKDMQN